MAQQTNDDKREKSRRRWQAIKADPALHAKRKTEVRERYRALVLSEDALEARREASRRGYARHAEEHRRRLCRNNLLRKYNLSAEDYDKRLSTQGGVCAICGRREERRAHLSVDHCHITGRVRGLLCDRCNVGLGRFRDSAELLSRAAIYLEAASCVAG